MAEHLLQQTLSPERVALAEYYTRGLDARRGGDEPPRAGCVPTPRRDLHPRVAEILGLDPNAPLSLDGVTHLLGGRRADGTPLATNASAAARTIAYVDLCFSAPKAVSLAWAFAPTEAERCSILGAHADAVDAALRYLAGAVGKARRGDGGTGGAEPGHVAWVTFDHFTSRPTVEITRPDPRTGVVETEIHEVAGRGDPQLHTHCAVPNLVVTDGGHVGALDLAALRGRVHEFGAVYQAFLAANLRRIGIGVGLDSRTGTATLFSIPEEACREFSKRTRDATVAAREEARARGLSWDALAPDDRVAFLKGAAHAGRKGRGDDLGDFAAWAAQAEALGWHHAGAVGTSGAMPSATRAGRLEAAYTAALPFLDAELGRRAVIGAGDARAAAARGLVAAGIEDAGDVDLVTRAMRERGVRQGGRTTALVWGREGDRGEVRITTALHEEAEAEVVRLAQGAAADRSAALTREAIVEGVRRTGLGFEGEHGASQQEAMERLGEGGRLAVAVGAAGAGKTTLLRPLVAAWEADGRQVHGVALAWRQAHPLAEAGISPDLCRALSPFLDRAGGEALPLGPRSVIVLDELGQVGARQLLQLLRLREQHGFTLVALGDDRQCASVEAGPVVALLRHALGDDAIPEVATTRRQRTERERRIAGLFRDGKTAEALAMKRSDGTAELVPGGREEAVRRVAALWRERREVNRGEEVYSLTVSAPSNADARAVAAAIREARRAMGEVGPDLRTVEATDPSGAAYALPLAAGDRIRLFARTNATFAAEGGKGTTVGNIGNNGSVLEVLDVGRVGLRLRTSEGRVGIVRWESLRDPASGRVRLAHGDVLTVDAAQGLTSTEHILAAPGGSASLGAGRAYVGASRHVERAWFVGSDGAERREAASRRAVGDPRPVTAEDAWANVARNLARRTEKESALTFLERARGVERGAARAMQGALRTTEGREAAGAAPTTLAGNRAQREEGRVLARVVAELRAAMEARWAALRSLAERLALAAGGIRPGGRWTTAPDDRAAVVAEHVAGGLAPGSVRAAFRRRVEERAVADVAGRLVAALEARGGGLARLARRTAVDRAEAAAQRLDRPPRTSTTGRAAFSRADVEVAFADALRGAGFRTAGGVVMDGTLRRLPVEGDRRGQRSGSYVGHLDGWPAGYVRNHRTGVEVRWKAEAPASLGAGERAALAAEAATAAARRAELREAEARRAARLACRLWEAARPATSHPYLAAKGVGAHGVRVDTRGQLLVPVCGADGHLWGLQRIGPDGAKLFLKGARTEGGHALLGRLAPGAPLLVAEGYATAATLHEATGHAVAVAFNASNLAAVARAYRTLDAGRTLIIAGDDDRHLPLRAVPLPNVGRERAEAAAAEVGGVAAFPAFAAGERGTDWNDLARRRGGTAVAEAIRATIVSADSLARENASRLRSAEEVLTAGRGARMRT